MGLSLAGWSTCRYRSGPARKMSVIGVTDGRAPAASIACAAMRVSDASVTPGVSASSAAM